MRALMWFRRDLRVRDNTALHAAACAADRGVVGLFLISPTQWARHHDAPCKIRFWLDHLKDLSASLAKLNIPLLIREAPTFASVPEALLSVARKVKAETVFFNREYEVNERRRDDDAVRLLSEQAIDHHAFDDHVLIAPDGLRTQTGRCYTVFTPFRRAWLAHAKKTRQALKPLPRKQPEPPVRPSRIPKTIPGFESAQYRSDLWPAGERAALRRLTTFADKAAAYHQQRDAPAVNGTSGLSPYLAAGVLSPRQCLEAVVQTNRGRLDSGKKGVTTWISELIWRDFYTHVLVGFPRVSMNRPFNAAAKNIPWRGDPAGLEAWKNGATGYPLVDAAMRQLTQTGWMHNRLRMVTAMFLTKHLLIDWRLGEQHFMQNLVDGDLAANNGGWQWSASTGTDAAPYFRIFNPYSQSKRFDPQGAFIQKFCPHLSSLDAKWLHKPSGQWPTDRSELGYPPPVVDHPEARARALGVFKDAKTSR